MNQAEVTKLVSKLRVNVPPRHRNLRNVRGPEGRIDLLRKTVTGLIKFERIELNQHRGDEARQYAERLISEAIRHGDCHKATMDIADYWLLEKELVHKLFKVLVPRYEHSTVSYTKIYNAPRPKYDRRPEKVVLELRGNPYPGLINRQGYNKLLIQNVLLDAAKYDYRQSKYAEIAEDIGKSDSAAKENITSKSETNETSEKTSES